MSVASLTARVPDGVVALRAPRPGHGAAWSAARLANRQWLEAAFPAWGDDWAAEQSETAWLQRCGRLRLAAARGRAMPFVILLDGALVGEIGVDALDEASNSGEASVWMLREHGSSMVMYAASLLLLDHAFCGPRPLDRMLSPVATAYRKGRAPGLTAVGLQIEGTLARRVGERGFVDHDIWVVHNTATVRDATAGKLAPLRAPDAPPDGAGRPRPAPLAQAAVRELRQAARSARRSLRPAAAWWLRPVQRDGVTLRPPRPREAGWAATRLGATTQWVIERDGRVAGTLGVALDPGTGTAEITASAPDDLLDTVLRAALQRVADAEPGLRRAVRLPLTGAGTPTVEDSRMTALGLTLVATFPGRDNTPARWPGEQRWEAL